MKYSALIGEPTDYSVSHILFPELSKAAKLPEFYQHIRVNVAPDELEQSLAAFNTLHFVGLNVTLPYKLEIMQYLDSLDPVVHELGAVNAIKLGETTTGYNTDWVGITKSVKQFGNETQYETATIFGTGGAARAAIYACKQLGIRRIYVLHRSEVSESTDKMQEQSESLGVLLYPYSKASEHLQVSQLIINATSAGMIGKDATPLDLATIEEVDFAGKVFLDAVFKPLKTPLLTHFESKGATVIDGLWMMIYQAVGALEVWFDRDIEVSTTKLQRIHNLLEKELQHV